MMRQVVFSMYVFVFVIISPLCAMESPIVTSYLDQELLAADHRYVITHDYLNLMSPQQEELEMPPTPNVGPSSSMVSLQELKSMMTNAIGGLIWSPLRLLKPCKDGLYKSCHSLGKFLSLRGAVLKNFAQDHQKALIVTGLVTTACVIGSIIWYREHQKNAQRTYKPVQRKPKAQTAC